MSYNYAHALLEIGAIKLDFNNRFTWASGIKSPIYTDNRKVLSYPIHRDAFINGLVELIKEKFPDSNAISGVATAGIAHAALISNQLELPLTYVRSSNKSHGLENKIEGVLSKGQKVVVIEDLISTGGSSIEAVNALRESGAHVMGVVSIFSYNTKLANENFAKTDIPFYSLVTVDSLIKEANLADGEGAQLTEFLTDL